jgi:hypothetical protein
MNSQNVFFAKARFLPTRKFDCERRYLRHGGHFHPPRLRHYLAWASDVHYDKRPRREGDVKQR